MPAVSGEKPRDSNRLAKARNFTHNFPQGLLTALATVADSVRRHGVELLPELESLFKYWLFICGL